jgi:hypothetical protein
LINLSFCKPLFPFLLIEGIISSEFRYAFLQIPFYFFTFMIKTFVEKVYSNIPFHSL